MEASFNGKYTVEDIIKDFPDKDKTFKYLVHRFGLIEALIFKNATYRADLSKKRQQVLQYTNNSLIAHIHLDSYKKEDGKWMIHVAKEMIFPETDVTLTSGKVLELRAFMKLVAHVMQNETTWMYAYPGKVCCSFELDPKEVEVYEDNKNIPSNL